MMAAPVAIASRFDSLDHCIEASISAAAALRKLRIKAEAVPVGVLARRDDLAVGIGVEPPSEAQYVDLRREGSTLNLHMVVDARMGGDRWIVDPTIGQLRRLGVDVPLQVRFAAQGDLAGWGFDTDSGWEVTYAKSPHAPSEVAALTETYRRTMRGLADDMGNLIGVALKAGLDHDVFERFLSGAEPATWEQVMRRLTSWHEVASPDGWAAP